MLNPPAQPNCVTAQRDPMTTSSKVVADVPQVHADQSAEQQGVLAARTIVEFERDCYRSAEHETRQKLEKLQKAVRVTKQAIQTFDVK